MRNFLSADPPVLTPPLVETHGSQSARIRLYLQDAKDWRTAKQIAAGTGIHRHRVGSLCCTQVGRGVMLRRYPVEAGKRMTEQAYRWGR